MKAKFLFLSFFLFFILSSYAQDSVQIDTVIINALNKPVALSKEYKIIQVIDKQEINHLHVTNISELLDKLSAYIDLKYRGSGDVQADMSMDGSGFNDVLILINGVKVKDYQTGHFSMNLPIFPEMIQRIEILTGPDMRKYGLGAGAGAINIITDMSDRNIFSTSVGFYERTGKPIISAALLSKDFFNGEGLIGAQVKQSEGYAKNTDYDQFRLFAEHSWSFSGINFFSQTGFLLQKFGALNFYTPKYPYQYEQNNQQFVSLVLRPNSLWTLTASWRRHQDKFELFREGDDWYIFDGQYYIMNNDTASFAPGLYYKGHNYHANNTFDLGVNHVINTKLGRTYLQIELLHTYIRSNVLGNILAKKIKVPFESLQYFDHAAARTNMILGVDHVYQSNKFSLSAGASLIYNRFFGVLPAGGLDMSFNIFSYTKLFLGLNHSMRLPTFTEMYYKDPLHLATTNLKPEKSDGIYIGVKMNKRGVQFSQSLFYVHNYDKIDWVWNDNKQLFVSQNLTSFDSYGTNINMRLNSRLFPKFLKTFILSYSLFQYKNFSFPQSKYSANLTHQKVNTFISFRLWQKRNNEVLLSYNFTFKQRLETFVAGDKKNVKLSDLIFSYDSSIFDISLKVKNLFNVAWNDYYTPMPGRTYLFTLNLKF